MFFESLGKKGLHHGSFMSLPEVFIFWGCSGISSYPCSYFKNIITLFNEYCCLFLEKTIYEGYITSTRWQVIARGRKRGIGVMIIFWDWYISIELSQSTGLANNSLISIKFFSVSFPEILKVIAEHSMKYTGQIFFHYHN